MCRRKNVKNDDMCILYIAFVCSFRVDKDKSGAISVDELQSALSNGKACLTTQ